MFLSVTGVNHDTEPIQVREQFALLGQQAEVALARSRSCAAECVILSTCNRFEVYTLQRDHQSPNPRALLTGIFGAISPHIDSYLYSYRDAAASEHIFRVASGLESQILGEVQILGQVQRSWQAAHKAGAVGPVLSQLFHRAVALGKRVHTETPISRQPASISYAAVVLAKQILGTSEAGTLAARQVLVIGTGEVGEGVARCLHDHGLSATVVAHRRLERAHNVARRYHAEVARWEDLPEKLAAADIVISSTSAPHTILQHQHIADAMRNRGGRPLYLIDLAVPRDIDPAASDIPGVRLHNIDNLQEVVTTTLQERSAALPAVQAMIDMETARFAEWLLARSTAPTIRELQAQADEVTRAELQWALSKLPALTSREQQVVEAMASRITGKLLHGPIQWLKARALDSVEPEYTLDALDPKEVADLFYSDAEGTSNSESEE